MRKVLLTSKYLINKCLYNPFLNTVPESHVSHKLHFYFLTLLIQCTLAMELTPTRCHRDNGDAVNTLHTPGNPSWMCNLPEHRWVLPLPLHSRGGCLYLLIPEANQPQLWTHVKSVKGITYILKPYWHFINIFASLLFPCQSFYYCSPLIHRSFINISSTRFYSRWMFSKYC